MISFCLVFFCRKNSASKPFPVDAAARAALCGGISPLAAVRLMRADNRRFTAIALFCPARKNAKKPLPWPKSARQKLRNVVSQKCAIGKLGRERGR